MRTPEEYRKRAKEARKQANACRDEYERQGLLIIADQCERIASYKDLTDRPSVTAPAQAGLREPQPSGLHSSPRTVAQTSSKLPLC